jgi:hypothetical protein
LRRFSTAIVTLSSAFTPMNETEAYPFQKYVSKLSDFSSEQDKMEKGLAFIRAISEGRPEEPPSALAIFPGRGPRWLRWLLDQNVATRMLNDAVFTAIEVKVARPELHHRSEYLQYPRPSRPTGVAPRQPVRLLIASLSPEQLFHGQASRNNSDGRSFDCRPSSGHRVQFADDTLGTTWLVRNASQPPCPFALSHLLRGWMSVKSSDTFAVVVLFFAWDN